MGLSDGARRDANIQEDASMVRLALLSSTAPISAYNPNPGRVRGPLEISSSACIHRALEDVAKETLREYAASIGLTPASFVDEIIGRAIQESREQAELFSAKMAKEIFSG